GAGIVKSVDGGAACQSSKSCLTVPAVRAVVIDLSIAAVLCAGSSFGMFKGEDAGATWRNSDLTGRDVRALAIDLEVPLTVYAGTNSGVFKSINAGASWTPILFGPNRSDIRALAIDPQTPGTLYAALGGGSSGG